MAKRVFKFEIYGYGGEYSLGTVEDENIFNELKNLAENGELGAWNELEDEEVNFYDYEEIFHTSGANFDSVNLYATENGKDFDVNYSEITNFSISNPYINTETEPENVFGYFGGASIEKGGFGTFEIETDGEDFDPSRLVFGTVNMDETLNNDEIIEEVYYITDFQPLREFLEKNECSDFEDDEIIDLLYEVIELPKDTKQENPLKQFEIEIDFDGDTNGKDSFGILYGKDGYSI
jgi:hypothetical protein